MGERARASRRAGPFKRSVLALLILAAFVLLLYFIVIPLVAPRIAERMLGRALGVRVSIGAIRLSGVSQVRVERFFIFPRGDAVQASPALAVNRVELSWGIRGFRPFLGPVAVRGVRADVPRLIRSFPPPSRQISPERQPLLEQGLAAGPSEIAAEGVELRFDGARFYLPDTRLAFSAMAEGVGLRLEGKDLSASVAQADGSATGMNIFQDGSVTLVGVISGADLRLTSVVIELPEVLRMELSGEFRDVGRLTSGTLRFSRLQVHPGRVTALLGGPAEDVRLSDPISLDGVAVEFPPRARGDVQQVKASFSLSGMDISIPARGLAIEKARARAALTLGPGESGRLFLGAEGGVSAASATAGGFSVPALSSRFMAKAELEPVTGDLSVKEFELSSPSFLLRGSAELSVRPGAVPWKGCNVEARLENIAGLLQGKEVPNLDLESAKFAGRFQAHPVGHDLVVGTGSFSVSGLKLGSRGQLSALPTAGAEVIVRANLSEGATEVRLRRFSLGDALSGRATAELEADGVALSYELDPLKVAAIKGIVPSVARAIPEALTDCVVEVSGSAGFGPPELSFTNRIALARLPSQPQDSGREVFADLVVSGKVVTPAARGDLAASGEISGSLLGAHLVGSGRLGRLGNALEETPVEGSLALTDIDLENIVPELSALLGAELPPARGKVSLSASFSHPVGSPWELETSVDAQGISTAHLSRLFFTRIPASAKAKLLLLPDLRAVELQAFRARLADSVDLVASGRLIEPLGNSNVELKGEVVADLAKLPLKGRYGQAEGQLKAAFWMRPLAEDPAQLEVGGEAALGASRVALPGGTASLKDVESKLTFEGTIPGPRELANGRIQDFDLRGRASVEVGEAKVGGLGVGGLGAALDFYPTTVRISAGMGKVHGGELGFDGSVLFPQLDGKLSWRLRDLDTQQAVEALGHKDIKVAAKLSGAGMVSIKGAQLADLDFDMSVGPEGMAMDRKLARRVLDYSLAQAFQSLPFGSIDSYLGPSDPHRFEKAKVRGRLRGDALHLEPILEDSRLKLTYDISLDMGLVWEYLRSQQEMVAAAVE